MRVFVIEGFHFAFEVTQTPDGERVVIIHSLLYH